MKSFKLIHTKFFLFHTLKKNEKLFVIVKFNNKKKKILEENDREI